MPKIICLAIKYKLQFKIVKILAVKIFIQEIFTNRKFSIYFWYKQINWTLDYSYVIDDRVFDAKNEKKL